MSIAIIGAGIGGLAAALNLHDAGFRDIQIREAIGVAPRALSYRNHLGQENWTEARVTGRVHVAAVVGPPDG